MIAQSLLLLGLSALAQAKVQFLGVAIAGGDFGCQIDGSCPLGSVQLPLTSLGGGDGQGQMNHWAKDKGLNLFRLPVSWQFLVNNQPSGPLNANNFGRYDQLVQACLQTGAYCMIEIHNFARYDGRIIGQGGPSDDDFANLWTQLATKYAANQKVVFELMNEPHDLDIGIWAQTCQKAVTAIRNAGAKSQMVLLPGTNFDSAATLVSSGSADLLMAIKNPDGTTDGLLLDIHKYLDVDNSGTHKECTTDNTAAFQTVADYLRKVGRKGFVSETGASMDATCITAFRTQNTLINQNPDVFVGLVAWGAGSFSTSYVLSMTPTKNGNTFTDNVLMNQFIDTWLNTNAVAPPSQPQQPAPAASASASAPGNPNLPATQIGTGPVQQPTVTPTVTPIAAPTTTPNGTPSLSTSITQILPTGVFAPSRQASSALPTTLILAAGTPTVPSKPPLAASTGLVPSSNGTINFPGTASPTGASPAGGSAAMPSVRGVTVALLAAVCWIM